MNPCPGCAHLGVGINLQPNATRELIELGLERHLDDIGVRTRQYGFYTKFGLPIWEEPRGLAAGYKWPQISVHRGKLQMMLLAALIDRAGPDCVMPGRPITGYEHHEAEVVARTPKGEITAKLLVACDGIHSSIRAQMHPTEGAPIWSGAVLWRGVAQAKSFFGGASMALAGHDDQRIVAYPISAPDADTGLVTMNFIAERRFDPAQGWAREDWNRAVDRNSILPDFETWQLGWLDVPGVIRAADQIPEYPMVDREPQD